jgi:hypothetical protein
VNRLAAWLLAACAGFTAWAAGTGTDDDTLWSVLALVLIGMLFARWPAPRRPGLLARWREEDHAEWRRQADAEAARRRYERHREQQRAIILGVDGTRWEVTEDHRGGVKNVRWWADDDTHI